jgi:hypothetical protein
MVESDKQEKLKTLRQEQQQKGRTTRLKESNISPPCGKTSLTGQFVVKHSALNEVVQGVDTRWPRMISEPANDLRGDQITIK